MGRLYNELSDKIDREMQDCPDCYGTGEILDDYDIRTGKSKPCPNCKGTGKVPYTDEDRENDEENENIGNAEMMNDDV
jgi:DnaJ-class molecular chaperone